MKKQTMIATGVLAGAALLAGNHAMQAGGGAADSYRPQGPAGLALFLQMNRADMKIDAHKANIKAASFADDAEWRQLSQEIDLVAGQKDAWASKLYWYTDLVAAEAAAKAQHKPILSLRMLGKLTDEYSCANSRFFRAALYSNEKISKTLRDGYILHWSSERPVPVVTIDMGDGRVLKRTLTGNSAHYLLDTQGRPLDVLPGLYGPGAFQSWLEKGAALFKECDGLTSQERGGKLKAWHEGEIDALAEIYLAETKAGNPTFWAKADQKAVDQARKYALTSLKNVAQLEEKPAVTVPAMRAGFLAMTKSGGEAPVLNATVLYRGSGAFSREQVMYWRGMKTQLEQARLDENSRLLIRSQHPTLDKAAAAEAGFQQVQFSIPQDNPGSLLAAPPADPFERLIDNFERNMALDTARNEWNMHAPLHQWLATHQDISFDELNRTVYDKLFLTPKSDPWLGLSPAGTFTGLTDGGLFPAPNAGPQRQAKLQK